MPDCAKREAELGCDMRGKGLAMALRPVAQPDRSADLNLCQIGAQGFGANEVPC